MHLSFSNMKYFSMITLPTILIFVFICCAEASPVATPARRSERSPCPRNIRMICPTEKKYFVVHSSWKGRWCEFDEPIMVTALRDCDNSIMDTCKDRWKKKPNNCSAPLIKEVVDNAFQGVCFLHDLCYLSRNTGRKDCDDWFLHNMKQMCSIRRNWFKRSLCKFGARTVYWAVRAFGGGPFYKGKSWAKENCYPRNGLDLGSAGNPQQPDNEQSTEPEQTELEQADENSPKPAGAD